MYHVAKVPSKYKGRCRAVLCCAAVCCVVLCCAGFREAEAVAKAELEKAAFSNVDAPETFRNDLLNIARTTLSSKILTGALCSALSSSWSVDAAPWWTALVTTLHCIAPHSAARSLQVRDVNKTDIRMDCMVATSQWLPDIRHHCHSRAWLLTVCTSVGRGSVSSCHSAATPHNWDMS
jgi:hypothetical protein